MDNPSPLNHLHQPPTPRLFAKTTQWTLGSLALVALCFVSIARWKPGVHTLALSRVIPVVVLFLIWNPLLQILVNYLLHDFVGWISFGFLRVPWVNIQESPTLNWLALLMLILAPIKRWHANRELFLGRGWYTYSPGDSPLCFVLPKVRRDLVNRFIEPAVCIYLGYRFYSDGEYALGVWLIISAISIWWSEQKYLEVILASQFARHNDRALAVMQAKLVGDITSSIRGRANFFRRLGAVIRRTIVALPSLYVAAENEFPRLRAKVVAFSARYAPSKRAQPTRNPAPSGE